MRQVCGLIHIKEMLLSPYRLSRAPASTTITPWCSSLSNSESNGLGSVGSSGQWEPLGAASQLTTHQVSRHNGSVLVFRMLDGVPVGDSAFQGLPPSRREGETDASNANLKECEPLRALNFPCVFSHFASSCFRCGPQNT